MYILRKICEIGSFEVRIISPCGTFCQFGEGTIPCPSHHLFRQGVQLNNSANVSNHFQIGGGMGVLGYNKNCVAQKNFLDALASLDSKLSVSQSVIDVFRLSHLRVFQSYFSSRFCYETGSPQLILLEYGGDFISTWTETRKPEATVCPPPKQSSSCTWQEFYIDHDLLRSRPLVPEQSSMTDY